MKKALPWMVSLLTLGGCAAGSPASYVSISMDDAVERMETESGHILLDVRSQSEFDAGHIPGAILLPNVSIGGKMPEQLPDKGQTIFVYCRSGNRSKQAAAKLAALGYTAVVEIGGIYSWPGEVVTD